MVVTGFGSDYDSQNAQYENGTVNGNDLQESSGMVKIGYVIGKSLTTSIGDHIVTLSKKQKVRIRKKNVAKLQFKNTPKMQPIRFDGGRQICAQKSPTSQTPELSWAILNDIAVQVRLTT